MKSITSQPSYPFPCFYATKKPPLGGFSVQSVKLARRFVWRALPAIYPPFVWRVCLAGCPCKRVIARPALQAVAILYLAHQFPISSLQRWRFLPDVVHLDEGGSSAVSRRVACPAPIVIHQNNGAHIDYIRHKNRINWCGVIPSSVEGVEGFIWGLYLINITIQKPTGLS